MFTVRDKTKVLSKLPTYYGTCTYPMITDHSITTFLIGLVRPSSSTCTYCQSLQASLPGSLPDYECGFMLNDLP